MLEDESSSAIPEADPIDFDRPAGTEAHASALRCSSCGAVPSPQYYELHGAVFCASCATRIQEGRSAFGAQRFGKALAFGLGAAVVCGAAYAAVVYYSGINLGLLSIVLGYAVGKAVFIGSSRVGGWKYQAMAMSLTYFANCLRFVPCLVAGAATGTLSKAPLFAKTITVVGIGMIAPFLILLKTGSGFISLLILSFGVYEAWKINRGQPSGLNGPFECAPAPATAF